MIVLGLIRLKLFKFFVNTFHVPINIPPKLIFNLAISDLVFELIDSIPGYSYCLKLFN